MVARFGEEAVSGTRVLTGANQQRVGVEKAVVGELSLWKQHHSLLVARLGEIQFSGGMCWWKQNHSLLAARFGKNAVIRRHVLVEVKSQRAGGSFWRREYSYLEACVDGSKKSQRVGASLRREGCPFGSGPVSFSVTCTSAAVLGVIERLAHCGGLEYVLTEVPSRMSYCTSIPPVASVTVAGAQARMSSNDGVDVDTAESRSNSSSTNSSSCRKYQSWVFRNILIGTKPGNTPF